MTPNRKRSWVIAPVVALLLVLLGACHSPPPSSSAAPDAGVAPSSSTTSSAAPSALAAASAAPLPGPPAPAVACAKNEDCAVAQVDVRGKFACCPGCGTTPGTRAWYAELQLWCGAHPPTGCPALACPIGATRAICTGGKCTFTSLSPEDGGPDFIVQEDKCLPVFACSSWVGCAKVRGDFQNGWYLTEAPVTTPFGNAPVGTEVTLEKDLCTPHVPGKCSGGRLLAKGLACPPQSTPPLVSPPKPCVLTGTSCHS